MDHFEFLRKSLSALGYEGRFFPKPDSPCLYLAENTGPDGCAIFYKADRFEMTASQSRVIEVWSVESNQVRPPSRISTVLTGVKLLCVG